MPDPFEIDDPQLLRRLRLFGGDTRLAVRYAIYRAYLAEQHINKLYSFLKQRLPNDAEFLGNQLDDWHQEVAELHEAFLREDTKYFDKCEQRFSLPRIH